MNITKFLVFTLIYFLVFNHNLIGQKNEKIKYKADELEYLKINKDPVRKLKFNVEFVQGKTKIKCDSAYYFNKKKIMEAYGNVIITDEDSLLITANKLIYNGNNKIADLFGEVRYSKNNNILETNYLIYDLKNKIGSFKEGGKLFDNNNVLSSDYGKFYSDRNYSEFNQNVELVSPEYTLQSDTLEYNSNTKIAYTFGQTIIITKDSTILNAKGGEFITDIKFSEFDKSTIETNEYFLKADEITLNKSKEFYSVSGNVKLISKLSNYIIIGSKGFYDKKNNITKIYDNPLLKKIIPNDTFYLSSDTIIAFEHINESYRKVVAFNDVKMIKENFEGKADSISYFIKDSLIYMFKEPIVWNNNNQISSDTISFIFFDNLINKMILNRNSFIISSDTMNNYNQIKGRNMTSYFDENNFMKKIEVNGNGESIYFALNDSGNSIIGLNYMICSDMNISFENNEIKNITFYKNPNAKLIPPQEISDDDLFLNGFKLRENERPILEEVVYYFRKKIYLPNEK